jgi:hypothetical protein
MLAAEAAVTVATTMAKGTIFNRTLASEGDED